MTENKITTNRRKLTSQKTDTQQMQTDVNQGLTSK